jgi:hypothetical protein
MLAIFYVGKVQMAVCWHCLDMHKVGLHFTTHVGKWLRKTAHEDEREQGSVICNGRVMQESSNAQNVDKGESSGDSLQDKNVEHVMSTVNDLQAQLSTLRQRLEQLSKERCSERASDLYMIEVLSQKVETLGSYNRSSLEHHNQLKQQLGVLLKRQDHLACALPQFNCAPAYFQPQIMQVQPQYPASPPANSLPLDVLGFEVRRKNK